MFCTLPISCQTEPLYLKLKISVLLAVAVATGAVLAANSKTVCHAIVLGVPFMAISIEMIAPATELLGEPIVKFAPGTKVAFALALASQVQLIQKLKPFL